MKMISKGTGRWTIGILVCRRFILFLLSPISVRLVTPLSSPPKPVSVCFSRLPSLRFFSLLPSCPFSLSLSLSISTLRASRKKWSVTTSNWQRMRWLHGITNTMDMSLSKFQETGENEGQESLVCCSPQGHKDLATEQQQQQGIQDHITHLLV